MSEHTYSRGAARRPAAVIDAPPLQWATGLTTTDRRIYAGWMIECGKDEALDEAAHAAGFERTTIKHGNGNVVTHWTAPTLHLHVICEGLQSIAEMGRTSERYGVAFGWRKTEDGRNQSALRMQVVVRELAAVGYTSPLIVGVKGTLTGDVINALMAQFDVLDAITAFRKEAGKPPMDLPFYACAIPLGPGQDVTRGTGSATKEITPIAAMVPSPVTKEYVKATWAGKELAAHLETLAAGCVAWSVAESASIAGGGAVTQDEAPAAAVRTHDPKPVNDEPDFVKAAHAYFDRYEGVVGGRTWADVRNYLQRGSAPMPKTLGGWQAVTEATEAKITRTRQRQSGTVMDEWNDIEATAAEIAARRK